MRYIIEWKTLDHSYFEVVKCTDLKVINLKLEIILFISDKKYKISNEDKKNRKLSCTIKGPLLAISI